MSIPCRSAISPHFLALHARHFTQPPCTYFSASSVLQIGVNLMGKMSFFRAKTLITRGICCIELDRYIMCGVLAWLMEQIVKDKYHSCPDILALRYAFVARSFD